jgi:hypothetical protein
MAPVPRARYPVRMTVNDVAADYRERADRCRQKAGESSGPVNVAYWLKFAEQWLRLA